jgi:D-serine deaminase-like pyridoxal phosphate-dependent protein
MSVYGANHGIGIRPHTKTHKQRGISQQQIDAGAVGLTAAKLGEAEIMAEISNDILLAYPAVDPIRAAGVARLASSVTVRVAIDSMYAADAIARAAVTAGSTVGILVDVDIGMHRTGLQTPDEALSLAQHVDKENGLRLDGIMCYPGHVWASAELQGEMFEPISAKLAEVISLWAQHGLEAPIVSGGSTPTAYQSHLMPELTEIRPGTYVYNDMNIVHGGYCSLDDCAARIICTVVSDAVPDQIVIDAGSKTLTSDSCLKAPDSGFGHIVEYPDARISALSEEHGQVDTSKCMQRPRIGEQVSVIPNHICPCVNLQDAVWWVEPGEAPKQISVDARGKIT